MQENGFVDMTGRRIHLPAIPQRIISLVPSQTELLYHLGLEDKVVGITKFCVHPNTWFRTKTRVGGTKQLNAEVIDSLKPDLIIANKEENEKEQIEALSKKYPVWISDIKSLNDALSMIECVGAITATFNIAQQIANSIKHTFSTLTKNHYPLRVAYFIWKDPWMCAGGDTFINTMIEAMGWVNVCNDQMRYPQVNINTLQADAFLLSSEPFPFKQKHIDELVKLYPLTKILLVDGEMFSWYGSRLLQTPNYLNKLQELFTH